MKKPVKITITVLIILILGSILGVGSAFLSYDWAVNFYNIKNGPWQTNLAIGSGTANPYLRAAVAVHGLLALQQSETIYYSAYTDDDGKLLNADNVYRIEGRAPDSRWWSITVYGEDDFLIPNELNRYSYGSNSVSYNSDGKFTIILSKSHRDGNWLPLGNTKRFSLSLRLYNPGESIRRNPANVELPKIIRE